MSSSTNTSDMSPPCPIKNDDLVIVELFSGRGDVSKIGSCILNCRYITIDIDAKTEPSYVADISKWTTQDTASLIKAIDGRRVILWASPPCEEYSIMKSTGGPRKLDHADSLVKMAYLIAKRLNAIAIVMENPATGLLHKRPVMHRLEEKVLKQRYVVSYCQYGHPVRKQTHIWCSLDLEKHGFKPLICNTKTCKSTYLNDATKQKRHLLHYDDFTDYVMRISVPTQLIADIFKALKISLSR